MRRFALRRLASPPAALTAADPGERFGRDLRRNRQVSRGWRQIPSISGQNLAYSQTLQLRLFAGTVQLGMWHPDRWHNDSPDATVR